VNYDVSIAQRLVLNSNGRAFGGVVFHFQHTGLSLSLDTPRIRGPFQPKYEEQHLFLGWRADRF